MITLLLVDDQNLIRQGLKALLELEPDLEVVGEAENGEIAISIKTSRVAARSAVQSYREHLNEYAQMTALDVWFTRIGVESLLSFTSHTKELKKLKLEVEKAQALKPLLKLHKLTETANGQLRFIDRPPVVSHPSPEDPLAVEILSVFHNYRHTLREDVRVLLDRYRVVDIAIKVVGVGSVGMGF
jgi:Uncharacterized protein conserved in bacteria (DUF2252)